MSGDARWGRRQTLGRASFLVAAVLACTLVVAAPTAASGKRDDLSGIYGLPQGAAVPRAGASCTRNIVVAMSSVGYVPLQNGQNHTVGYYLDELTIPLMALQDAGWNFTFANPLGNAPPMDPHSDSAHYFSPISPPLAAKRYARAHQLIAAEAGLQAPHRYVDLTDDVLESLNPDLIYIPGGHPPMVDLYKDVDLGRVLLWFADHQKPIAALCHGPTALLSAGLVRQPWAFAGRDMTVFSTAGEKLNEQRWGGKLLFYPADKLAAAGAVMHEGEVYMPNVLRDLPRNATDFELITGQNPYSADDVATFLTDALLRYCGPMDGAPTEL